MPTLNPSSRIARATVVALAAAASVATSPPIAIYDPSTSVLVRIGQGITWSHRYRVTIDGHPRRLGPSRVELLRSESYPLHYTPWPFSDPANPSPVCTFASDVSEPVRVDLRDLHVTMDLGEYCGGVGPCSFEWTIDCEPTAVSLDVTFRLVLHHVFDGSGYDGAPPGVFAVEEVVP